MLPSRGERVCSGACGRADDDAVRHGFCQETTIDVDVDDLEMRTRAAMEGNFVEGVCVAAALHAPDSGTIRPEDTHFEAVTQEYPGRPVASHDLGECPLVFFELELAQEPNGSHGEAQRREERGRHG